MKRTDCHSLSDQGTAAPNKLRPLGRQSRLLFYRVDQHLYHPWSVWYYEDPEPPDDRRLPSASVALERLRAAIRQKTLWKQYFSATERIMAELALRGQNAPFVLKYYCVGHESANGGNQRVASFFVHTDDEKHKPILSGCLDHPNPVTKDRIQKFFPRAETDSRWSAWASLSFSTIHNVQPVLSLSQGDTSYVAFYTKARLLPYPQGYVKGGLPFGKEDEFLAVCDLAHKPQWGQALDRHASIFSLWNLVCRNEKLERVYIQGEPGAGKELWYKAIKGGVQARLSGEWGELSATLDDEKLAALLYGERQGNLERRGYLERCEGGGLLLDEIGKSTKSFRRELLRVLESKEFVPRGGEPIKFKHILFIFASTERDRREAFDPPDFWTRMDVELELPTPISVNLHEPDGLTALDEARLYALFAHFWFPDPARLDNLANVGTAVDPTTARSELRGKVFEPFLLELRNWRLNNQALRPRHDSIPVSPRRVRALATTLDNEYRWLGSAANISTPEARAAQAAWSKSVHHLTFEFLNQLVMDEKNRFKAGRRPDA